MWAAMFATCALGPQRLAASSCESLATLALPDTTITLAQVIPAGTFTLPAEMKPPDFKDVPAFCRVTAEVKPTKDSDIKIEVWMPTTGWNAKYRGQGNGSFAGYIDYLDMADAVRQGYATASTDTGHSAKGLDATWALGHPEKVIDFGYRGIHEMTAKAKSIIRAFYGHDAEHSYFVSCSNGGRQGLMEAQRFPEDYDGIIAGAPAIFWTHLLVGAVWVLQAMQNDPASYIPAGKTPAISAAVLAACDAEDGVTDGIVNDPRKCRFDPAAMLCKGADSSGCLTAPQVTAFRKIHAGARNSKGELILPGYPPGGEEGPRGWSLWITGTAPGQSLQFTFATQFFGNMVFDDRAWDFKTFDFDAGVKITDERQGRNLNATDPNLKAFKSRGGKLILYMGWSDTAIPAVNTINYYDNVAATMGPRDADSFLRLYLVPGMQHCRGGPGPNFFGQDGFSGAPNEARRNMYRSLEQWVERGIGPRELIATKYLSDDPTKAVKMTRPLCPYPQVAKYKGTGDTNDEANFICVSELEKK
jgi:feruloyl esterase